MSIAVEGGNMSPDVNVWLFLVFNIFSEAVEEFDGTEA